MIKREKEMPYNSRDKIIEKIAAHLEIVNEQFAKLKKQDSEKKKGLSDKDKAQIIGNRRKTLFKESHNRTKPG